jgi:hypothetical protein
MYQYPFGLSSEPVELSKPHLPMKPGCEVMYGFDFAQPERA